MKYIACKNTKNKREKRIFP